MKRIWVAVTLVALVGCTLPPTSKVADRQLQDDILISIQEQYGKPGPAPLLMKAKYLGLYPNGSHVELWNVKLFAIFGTRDFLVAMNMGSNGITDYSVMPVPDNQKK